MKRMKKFFAVLMALTMVLGMTMTANAAITTPSAADTAKVTVSGLEAGTTVTAYKIVDAQYYASGEGAVGLKGYKVVDAVETLLGTGAYNMTAPTSDHITAIANAIAKNQITLTSSSLTWDAATSVYAADLTAGAYVIIAANTAAEMYNPMLAGVYYTNANGSGNDISGGNINADGNWTLTGSKNYAKSTVVPPFDKEIVNPGSGNTSGDDVAINDTVTFKLSTTIPKYSEAYKELTFKLNDILSTGLTPCAESGVTVKVGGTQIAEAATTYDLSITGQKLTIDFKEAFIRANGGKEVEVTYTAVLNDKALVNQNANPNDAELIYTNDPSGTTGSKKDKTYHHTFELKVKKTDEEGTALAGAEFTLYKEDGTTVVKKATSDTNGMLTFTGLDAGTYKLVETKAPLGFQIDNTVHTVVITAAYDATDGTITSYSIKIDGNTVESWTVESKTVTTNTMVIKNTRLISLPSTGGMGTTIFTIAGCAIMIAAAFFFFASRRKEYK